MPMQLATRVIATIGVLAMLALAAPRPVLAADGGQVAAVNGSSFVTASGQRTQLKATDLIHPGDVVEVSDGAKLKLSMSDGSVLSLGGSSRLTVTAYTADPGVSRDVQLNLDIGLMRAVVAAGGATSRFEIDTPTAVATVRGTDFFVEVTPQKTSIGVIEGSVAVVRRGAAPNANPMTLNANWQAEIDAGREPPKVRPWTQQEFDALVSRTGVGLGWCQCIADRTDIKGACLASVEDCRGACGGSNIYSFIPDARQTCTAPGTGGASGGGMSGGAARR